MISTDVLLHGKNNWNFTSQKMKITDTNPFTRTQANPALQTTPEQYPALGVLLSTHREDLRAEIQQDYSEFLMNWRNPVYQSCTAQACSQQRGDPKGTQDLCAPLLLPQACSGSRTEECRGIRSCFKSLIFLSVPVADLKDFCCVLGAQAELPQVHNCR